MDMEKRIAEVFSEYLENQGYHFNTIEIENLVDAYTDCQDWDDGVMVTGYNKFEMLDWIKHTKEVVILSSIEEMIYELKSCLCMYYGAVKAQQKIQEIDFVIDIA